MYRKICSENLVRIDDSELPIYITDEIIQQVEEEKKEASAREEKNLTIHFKALYQKKETTFVTRKDKTLKEFKIDVMDSFGINERPEDVRLRAYSTVYEVFQETYDEDKKISMLQCWDYKVFGVEIKASNEE